MCLMGSGGPIASKSCSLAAARVGGRALEACFDHDTPITVRYAPKRMWLRGGEILQGARHVPTGGLVSAPRQEPEDAAVVA